MKLPDNLSEKYNAWHQHRLTEDSKTPMDPKNFACWHQMLLNHLEDMAGKEVAEIGCGRGNFAVFLAQSKANMTALDFSKDAIAIAKERQKSQGVEVDWHVGDAQQTPFPDNAFDAVISCECLEHVPNPRKMIAELHRICKPGGTLYLTTPSYFNGYLIGWTRCWITGRSYNSGSGIQPHENFFFSWFILSWLKKANFKIVGRDGRIFPWLLLPRVNPKKLRTEIIKTPWLSRLFRPFALHQLYIAKKK